MLGKGHNEVIYGDALEIEFTQKGIPCSPEKKYKIEYKGVLLPHYYYVDFVLYDNIILEIKVIKEVIGSNIKQTLNYLAASKLKLGLLINFGEGSLKI